MYDTLVEEYCQLDLDWAGIEQILLEGAVLSRAWNLTNSLRATEGLETPIISLAVLLPLRSEIACQFHPCGSAKVLPVSDPKP